MLVVIGFTLIQLVPLVAYAIAPQQTPIVIERAKAWARTHWRRYAIWGLALIGAALVVGGIIELV